MSEDENITRLLAAADKGQDGALDELMRAVYDDLERVAQRHMDQQFGRGLPGVTMEPAALVNESFLRLIKQRKKYDNRGQFFAIATKIMLRVLVDYQRSRGAAKRGGESHRVTLGLLPPDAPAGPPGNDQAINIESLVEALAQLESLDVRKADVVKLRVIWGLQMREISESLDISLATVERDWVFAKAWLAREAAAGKIESPTRNIGADEHPTS